MQIKSICGIGLLGLWAVVGCGGPDLTSGMRGSYDSGLGAGYGSYGGYGSASAPRSPAQRESRGVYHRVELVLDIPEVQGNPFDYVENDVVVTITRPDQTTVRVPAFYDGATTWRVRYTPDMTGRHSVTGAALNGRAIQPAKMEPREFTVSGAPLPGFVRRDPMDGSRFLFSNGSAYYPLGMNVAWGDVVPIISKLGAAGGNWARVWMCHWGGTNLWWVMNKRVPEGQLDLETARKWDAIVEAAEKAGVYLQVVLQHHGQYSTRTNPNWAENPWNKANGGFLDTPGQFFVHPRARALTQARYRYILARWGYSPSIMAWELFNEVEWTDGVANRHEDEVVAWHDSMAQFLRQHDPYRHLVTTSSSLEIPNLFRNMDYVQPHAYPADALAVTTRFDEAKLDKPVFFGEIGPDGLRDDGTFLHRALWSSIASRTAGAAQYWSWEDVDRQNWYDRIKAAATFVRQSGMLSQRNLRPATVAVSTNERGPASLRPGGGWATARVTQVAVPTDGSVPRMAEVPSFLQGNAHRDMFPSLTLQTVFPQDGTVTVHVVRVSRAGGAVRISVDGKEAASKVFSGAAADRSVNESVSASVPAGSHAIKMENTGPDWVVVGRIDLDPYAPALGALGKSNGEFALLWVHNRMRSATSGRITLPGLKPGEYEIVWYDTRTGEATSRSRWSAAADGILTIETPAIGTDAAVTATRTAARAQTARSAPRRPDSRRTR